MDKIKYIALLRGINAGRKTNILFAVRKLSFTFAPDF
ncbi:MAG: DUF1697 domain-containing protein [Dysgonamonadaceae bacterium]|nr:DUF1697 domain-containing protein [Dysgonamonadaceae bacterium]